MRADRRGQGGCLKPSWPQTTAVDPQRLGDFAGRLSPSELVEINVALRAILDLE
jgi:mRNA-degrading endonuclease toxin of MazEF toxin-antitoxin module